METEGEKLGSRTLGPATKPKLANGKEGSARPKHGGKINAMTCSQLKVLENIEVSDAISKDAIFP